MNRDQCRELMNRVLDGEASLGEVENLQGWLQGDPALTEEFRELETIGNQLASMELVEPPLGLRTGVLSQITTSPRREKGVLAHLSGLVEALSAPFRRPSFAFAAGVLLGGLGLGLVFLLSMESTEVDPLEVSGAMSNPVTGTGQFQETRITGDQLDGVIRTREVGDQLLVTVELATTPSSEATLRYPAERLDLTSFSSSGLGSAVARCEPGLLSFVNSGQAVHQLAFRPKTEAHALLNLRLSRAGVEVSNSTFRVGR